MKTISSVGSALAALALVVLPANAQVTYPSAGDGYADGNAATDGGIISSVVVNNDANNITFTINSTALQASYIFYSIELQQVGQGGSGSAVLVNPWGENIGISTGVNALVNTYGTGASALTYGGGTWTQNASGSYAAGGAGFTYATMTLPLSSLGLSVGNSFYFDVVSSYANPGGQGAYFALDSLSQPAESDGAYQPWNGTSHYDSATDAGGTIFGTSASKYTVVSVPEPAALALLSGGALLLAWQRRHNR
jgi:hypothetical protein